MNKTLQLKLYLTAVIVGVTLGKALSPKPFLSWEGMFYMTLLTVFIASQTAVDVYVWRRDNKL